MFTRERVRGLGLAAAAVAVAVLVGCSSDSDSDSSGDGGGAGTTVYLNQYTREIPYFQEMAKGMDQAAAEIDWTVEKTFGNADPAQQVDQIENAIVTDPDSMVIIPVDEEAITPVMLQATDAGIPVAAMGNDITDEAAREFFLGVDYRTMGETKAEWLVDQLGGDGKIGFIHGIRGLNFTEQQNDGAMEVFDANPGIEVIDGPYTGGFSSDLGLKATENILAREPNLDAIYYDNDDLALGGIQAVNESGISGDDILIVGTDGGPAALAAVEAGDLDYTLSLCGFRQGTDIIGVLEDQLANGVEPPSEILNEPLAFTPENYSEEIGKVESGEC